MQIKMNQEVKCRLNFDQTPAFIKSGRVIYIHPENRFFVTEFEGKWGRRYRESFPMQGFSEAKKPASLPSREAITDEMMERAVKLHSEGKSQREMAEIMGYSLDRVHSIMGKVNGMKRKSA